MGVELERIEALLAFFTKLLIREAKDYSYRRTEGISVKICSSRRLNVRWTFKGGNREAGGWQRKRKNLARLGVIPGLAYAWSRSRMGGWRIAQSPILGSTITVARLKLRGYISMMDYYHLRRLSS